MGLSVKTKLKDDDLTRRMRELVSLKNDTSSERPDDYEYEMALKKRSISALLNEGIKEETGEKPKGIRWRKRKISED